MDKVDAIVSGSIRLLRPGMRISERIQYELEYPNPKYQATFITRQCRDGVPEWLSAMTERPDGSIDIPRGAVDVVKKVLAYCGAEPNWIDRRTLGDPIDSVVVPLRQYQEEGISAVQSNLQGILMMPCGSGKTRCGIAAIGRIARSAIVIVHTEDLLDQWVDGAKELLGIDAGVVADGEADWRPITVAMNRTLIGLMNASVNEFGEHLLGPWANFGVCIVDETHHCPSPTFQTILPLIPARWRIGLTATERDDTLNKVMYWTMGRKIHQVATQFLIRNGYLVPAEIEEVNTDFEFVFDGPDSKRMAALTRAIVSDEARNEKIARRAAEEEARGESVLVLSNNKAHCAKLGKLIEKFGGKPLVLVGSLRKQDKTHGVTGDLIVHKKKARKQVIKDMRSGSQRTLVATSLADEGIDIPILSRVILALPGASHRAVEQQIGRSMRPFQGKYPRLIDFVDHNVDTLVRRHKDRRTVYRKLGLI